MKYVVLIFSTYSANKRFLLLLNPHLKQDNDHPKRGLFNRQSFAMRIGPFRTLSLYFIHFESDLRLQYSARRCFISSTTQTKRICDAWVGSLNLLEQQKKDFVDVSFCFAIQSVVRRTWTNKWIWPNVKNVCFLLYKTIQPTQWASGGDSIFSYISAEENTYFRFYLFKSK